MREAQLILSQQEQLEMNKDTMFIVAQYLPLFFSLRELSLVCKEWYHVLHHNNNLLKSYCQRKTTKYSSKNMFKIAIKFAKLDYFSSFVVPVLHQLDSSVQSAQDFVSKWSQIKTIIHQVPKIYLRQFLVTPFRSKRPANMSRHNKKKRYRKNGFNWTLLQWFLEDLMTFSQFSTDSSLVVDLLQILDIKRLHMYLPRLLLHIQCPIPWLKVLKPFYVTCLQDKCVKSSYALVFPAIKLKNSLEMFLFLRDEGFLNTSFFLHTQGDDLMYNIANTLISSMSMTTIGECCLHEKRELFNLLLPHAKASNYDHLMPLRYHMYLKLDMFRSALKFNPSIIKSHIACYYAIQMASEDECLAILQAGDRKSVV